MNLKKFWIPAIIAFCVLLPLRIIQEFFPKIKHLEYTYFILFIIFIIVMLILCAFKSSDKLLPRKVMKSQLTGVLGMFSGLTVLLDSIFTLSTVYNVSNLVPKDSIQLISTALIVRCISGIFASAVFVLLGLSSYRGENKFKKYPAVMLIPVVWACTRAFDMFAKHSFSTQYIQMIDVIGIAALIIFLFYQSEFFAGYKNSKNDNKMFCFGVISAVTLIIYSIVAMIFSEVSVHSITLYISDIVLMLYIISYLVDFSKISESDKDDIEGINNSKATKITFEWLDALTTALIVVILIFTFVFKTVVVNGASMQNTLHDQDRLITINFMYEPKDGDVVVINPTEKLNERIIKRVIATEGQTLKIDFNKQEVYVDGKLLNEPYISTEIIKGNGDIPEVIPEGYVFVMGDNRSHSLDSRFKRVGLVDKKNIFGKAVFRFFPFNKVGVI